nr:DOF zinc finger protein DOF3.2 [Tanacetum cinerariifolium]
SSHAPPTGQPLEGVEDPITLTALSSVVSTLVQKVHSLEAELHDHKKLFKDVVGNLYAPTAFPPGASGVPLGASGVAPVAFGVAPGASNVSPGAFVAPTVDSAVPADSPKVFTAVPADSPNVPAGVSSKGKSLMVKEDIPVIARTFRKMEEDRLGEEAAKRLHDEEMVHMERERADAQRKRQQEKRQALAEQLSKERQNRPLSPAQQKAYMRQYVKNQSSAIYNTGWTMAYVKSFSDEQLKQEFEKIHEVQSHSQIQDFSRTLKRPGFVLEEPSPKRPKSPEVPTLSMPEVPISPTVTSPPYSRTR